MAAAGLAVVAVTFLWFLPTIADYGDVWDVLKELSWGWIAAFAAVVIVNLATFAPPWLVVLPRLRFFQALELTQASTALSIVFPAGMAAGMGVSFGMLQRWGFPRREITRAMTLVGLWNQFLNLVFPIVAVFLLTASGEETALLATAAFVGVAILGVAVTAFVLALSSARLAHEVGEIAARLTSWALGKVRRGPVSWGGPSFERFRAGAGELLARRWHLLTAASLAGSLSVYLVLLVSLRALGVDASQLSAVEVFAAWALVRLLGTVPITPGGIGVIELGLTTALVAFGGNNAGVVAAVLVYRFLTIVPTLVYGLVAAGTWRRHRPPAEPVPVPPVGTMGGGGADTTLRR
ncbi:MAG TPA: lysylphosphatidylglycerol synthase transmembrane domain-containing protein [Gaiellaceae bacterium]|nr:lysylphosphatidylglycerol synthase transmembrane domain-containing protein [Gaiellaceae bacterium]